MEIDLRKQYSPLPEEVTQRIISWWTNYKGLMGGKLWGDIYMELMNKGASREVVEQRLSKYNRDREIVLEIIKKTT